MRPYRFRRNYAYNYLTASYINRASGYIVNNPTLAPQATMWGLADAPQFHNRGAVADPAAKNYKWI